MVNFGTLINMAYCERHNEHYSHANGGCAECLAEEINKKRETCLWEFDEHHGFYETGCKNAFLFETEGIKENKFKFCPYCGKEIKEKQGYECRLLCKLRDRL